MLMKECVLVPNTGTVETNDRNKTVMFKNYKQYFLPTAE